MDAEPLRGGCHCGDISLAVHCRSPFTALPPRACDCGYCRRQGAAWFSDPDGSLRIALVAPQRLIHYRQGSNQADMVCCGRCGVLTHVCIDTAGGMYAAINVRVLVDTAGLADAVVVSPRQLPAAEKLARWQRLWFAQVEVGNTLASQ